MNPGLPGAHNSALFLLTVLFSVLLPACTSTRGLKAAESEGVWSQIKASGVHEDAKYVFVTQRAEPMGASEFTPASEKVTWWADFGNTFLAAFTPSFEAKWISPDGKVHLQQPFKKSPFQDHMLKTSMRVAGTSAEDYLGEWAVEIYFKGHRIDRKTFSIQTKEYREEVKTRQASLEKELLDEAARPRPQAEEPIRDPWYSERYSASRKAFASGDYQTSEKILNEILAKQPYRSEAHLALASIYYRQKRYSDSLRELDYAIQNPVLRDQAMELRAQIMEMNKGKVVR